MHYINYRRYLFDAIFSSPAKLTAIYGSRGVGKTTMILQLLQALPIEASKKLYISCDHASLQGVSLFDFIDEFSKRGGAFICIDEVHDAQNKKKEF